MGFEEGRVALAWGEWELEHGLTWNDRPLLLGDMRYFSVRQVLGADGWRGGWHRLGFQYRVGERLSMPGDTTPEPVVWGAAAVPLWWIMAVLIVVVCVVWWKTKAKGGPRAGFPVEVTA